MAKSKWDDVKTKLILVEGWARDGLVDTQIAKNLGIGIDTFYRYKNMHSEFSESLKRGKEVVDFEVENALLKRALGYSFRETTREPVDGEMIITKTIDKQISPDVTAQIFWLKNRKPDKWREKQEIKIDDKEGNENITTIAGLLNNPVKTRTVDDIADE